MSRIMRMVRRRSDSHMTGRRLGWSPQSGWWGGGRGGRGGWSHRSHHRIEGGVILTEIIHIDNFQGIHDEL
jgi:hypothetical protein